VLWRASPRLARKEGVSHTTRRRAVQIGADIAKLALAAQRQATAVPKVLCGSEVADRTAWRDHLRGGNDGVGVYAIVPVQLVD
jgi:hypothetical protein